MKLLIKNIGELLTMRRDEKGSYEILKNATIYIENELIKKINDDNVDFIKSDVKIIDALGMVLTPGFIDCHTHLVFGGAREEEFEMRAMGCTYEEIMKSGGGIISSMNATRKANKEELFELGIKRLNKMLTYGVTTCEIKSGYGLNTENEIKTLEVINELKKDHAIDILSTFLGAHEIPPEYKQNRSEYINILINEMLPVIRDRNLADFCDIFCEEGVFTIAESRTILSKAKEMGFKLKIHADEFKDTGGAGLAAEIGAVSAEHLLCSSLLNLEKMKRANVTAVLLPGVSFYLKKKYVNARKLLDIGLNVALGTDFNPGSSMTSFLPLMASLACINMGLKPIEALAGITIGAAKALDIENKVGSLEVDKIADILFFDIPSYKFIPYNYGENHIKYVMKRGQMIYE